GGLFHKLAIWQVIGLQADHGAIVVVLIIDHFEGMLRLEGERPCRATAHRKVVPHFDRPASLLGPEAGNRWEIGIHIDEWLWEFLYLSHPEVDLAKTAHADLGKRPPCRISTPGTHTTIDDACAVIQFMVRSVKLLGQIGEVVEYFKCQFVNT